MSTNTNFNYVIYKHYSEQRAKQNNLQNNIQDNLQNNLQNNLLDNILDNKNINGYVIPKQDQGKITVKDNESYKVASPAMRCLLL